MDLDVIDLSNTECYKCHKKGHISQNCRSGKKSFTPHHKKGPTLSVIDLIPTHADLHQDYEVRKPSMESKINIDGSTDPDPQEELEEYKKNYLETLADLDPSSILDSQKEAEVFAKNSERVCCESCYRFGCYDSPRANYELVVGKRGLSTMEEDPEVDNRNDSSLFCFDLDIPFREQDTILLKRRKIDSIDGYWHQQQSRSPEPCSIYQSIPQTKAEKELLCVENWNKILSKATTQNNTPLLEEYTDLEISVLERLEDLDPIRTAMCFGKDLECGESQTLNMADLENVAVKSTHRPLPIYYFENGTLTLQTILDTGAATNYISEETVKFLHERKDSIISVKEVMSQRVRLANGEAEETNKVALVKIKNGKYKSHVDAFILSLPNIDHILGLPWYQKTKPVIDFSSHIYYVQKWESIVPLVPDENRSDVPTLCADTAVGKKKDAGKKETSFGNKIKKLYPGCFKEEVLVSDRLWKHGIDTGDARPLKTNGRPHTPAEHAVIKQFVEDGLKQGIIKKSSSPWSAPLILIKNPTGQPASA